MNFNPSIPQEKALARQIYNALEGDVISSVISVTGAMRQKDDSMMRAGMEVTSIKVEREVMPRLYDALYSAKNALGFKPDVEFYITNSPQVNACTYFGTTPGRPLIVELNSSLIELMSEDELKFVVGHELGHQIDGNSELTSLIYFVFPDLNNMSPLLFQLKVRFWQQLCEVVADRYGYLAVGDLDVCVSAFFKMHSGLNLKRMDIDIKSFIEHNRRLMKHYTDEIDTHMPYFIASAGLMIANADGQITQDEVESILMSLASYELFPQDVLDEVFNSGDPVAYFNKSVSSILDIDPQMRQALFQYVVDLVLVDKKLKEPEIQLMKQIGTQVFSYSEEEVMTTFAISIRNSFRPSFSAIC